MPKTFNKDRSNFREGDTTISTRGINDLKEAIPRQIVGAGRGISVQSMGDRLSIDSDLGQPNGSRLIRAFVIETEFDDFLLCAPYDFASGSPNYDVNLANEQDVQPQIL